MAIRAFLSFVEEDLALVNLFRGKAKCQKSDLEFADYSIKEPFDSTNTQYIQRGITDQLKLVTLTVCLYGPTDLCKQVGGLGTEKDTRIREAFDGRLAL